MEFSVEEQGDVHVVRVREPKLTYPVLPSFFAGVRQLVDDGARKLVIDLQVVSYVDSASIGCFMDIYRLFHEKSGAVCLASLQPRVETMISMTGVHKIVPLHRDVPEAVAALARRRGGKHDA